MGVLGFAKNFLFNTSNPSKDSLNLSENEVELMKAMKTLEDNGFTTPTQVADFFCDVFVANSFSIQLDFQDTKNDTLIDDRGIVKTAISQYNTFINADDKTKTFYFRDIQKDLKSALFKMIDRIENCVAITESIDNMEYAEKMKYVAHQLTIKTDFYNTLARKYFDLIIVCIGYLIKINDEVPENIITEDLKKDLDRLFSSVLSGKRRWLLSEYDPTCSEFWNVIPCSVEDILLNESSDFTEPTDDDFDFEDIDF